MRTVSGSTARGAPGRGSWCCLVGLDGGEGRTDSPVAPTNASVSAATDGGASFKCGGRFWRGRQTKALMPVMLRPTINVLISRVPS